MFQEPLFTPLLETLFRAGAQVAVPWLLSPSVSAFQVSLTRVNYRALWRWSNMVGGQIKNAYPDCHFLLLLRLPRCTKKIPVSSSQVINAYPEHHIPSDPVSGWRRKPNSCSSQYPLYKNATFTLSYALILCCARKL